MQCRDWARWANHVVSHRRKQRAFLPSNYRESVTDLPIGA
jgi:hypothetical protein